MASILCPPLFAPHAFLERLVHFRGLNTQILRTCTSVWSTAMSSPLQTWIFNCLWLSSSTVTFNLSTINLITIYSPSTWFIHFIITYSLSLYFLSLKIVPQIYFPTQARKLGAFPTLFPEGQLCPLVNVMSCQINLRTRACIDCPPQLSPPS